MRIDLRRTTADRAVLVRSLLIALGVIFVIITSLIVSRWSPLYSFDIAVTARAHDWALAHDDQERILEVIAVIFSNWSVAALLLVIAAVMLRFRERMIALWLAISVPLVLLGNIGFKYMFNRPRPVWDPHVHSITGSSFPSGHSAGMGLFAATLVVLTIAMTGRGLRRRLLIGLWVTIALLVAASRVFYGVHHPSDIVAGLAFGALVPSILWFVLMANQSRLPSALAVSTGSGGRRSAVIINPVKVGDVDVFKSRVRQIADKHGWGEPLWFETTMEDPGHGQTRSALDAKVDLIVAAGGDGTIRAVCETAARSGVAVGILPHGTGNLLARNLQIPINIRDAIDVVFAGQDRAIDVATFSSDNGTDTTFLVMAGLGMDAMIMSGVNEDLKRRIGYLAYFASGLKAATFPRVGVKITIDDGEPRAFKARTVVIGNVGFLQGGLPLLPHAQIDDGLLDVIVIAPKRFLGWLSIIVRILTRRPRNNDRLTRMRGSRVRVEAEKPVPMQLDGDPAGEGRTIETAVQAGVTLIRVPLAPPPAE